jgi:hypothetical protein
MQSARKKIHPHRPRLELNERDFFMTLRYRPEMLTRKLTAAINSLVQDYAENFSALNNALVRRTFAIFFRFITTINNGNTHQEGREPNMEIFDRYCSLCGMLGSARILLLTDVEKSPHTSTLAEELGDILQASLIHKTDDGVEALHKCVLRFELKYGVMSALQLLEEESVIYGAVLQKVQTQLTRIKDHFMHQPDSRVGACYRRARDLLQTLEEEYKKPDFNSAFATAVLETTNKLLDKPTDVHLREKFARLARQAPGTPGLARKIGGCMLMFLGAVIIAASVLATILMPTPLLALAYSAGACLIGSGLFATRQAGCARQIASFVAAEKKAQAQMLPIAETFGYAPNYVFGR